LRVVDIDRDLVDRDVVGTLLLTHWKSLLRALEGALALSRGKKNRTVRYPTPFDILLRLQVEESHGTAPPGWDIRVCSLPLVPAVGIRWASRKARVPL